MTSQHQPFKKTLLAVSISQVLIMSASQANAATITVNSTADSLTPDGNCTLIEAITAANTDTTSDSCTAGSGADTINFDASLSGSTITLGSELIISSDITIDGDINGDDTPDITLSGNNTNRVIYSNSAYAALTLEALNVSNGYSTGSNGGAVRFLQGNLTINNSSFQNNYTDRAGGAIAHEGDPGNVFTISNSIFTSNDAQRCGAVFHSNGSSQTLNITKSVFTGNTATNEGGSVCTSSGNTTTITDSTISGNEAGTYGGGLYADDDATTIISTTISGNTAGQSGGGVYNNNTVLTINNSTISGNSATYNGGGVYSFNDVTLINSTIVNNTAPSNGGVYVENSVPLVITNSILANNTNGDCHSRLVTGTLTNSLIEDGGTNCGTATLTGDPDLGPLQDNGGPTLTHLPTNSSPVVDAGDNTDCGTGLSIETDQRGEARDDGACDIGAVEVQPSSGSSSSGGSMATVGLANNILLGFLCMLPFIRNRKRLKNSLSACLKYLT